ncbi:MAG: hypothetical protein ACYTX0_51055, partial [Nostoc sp.]
MSIVLIVPLNGFGWLPDPRLLINTHTVVYHRLEVKQFWILDFRLTPAIKSLALSFNFRFWIKELFARTSAALS